MSSPSVKLFPPLVKGIFTIATQIFQQGRNPESFIQEFLKSQSKWGARDRHFVAGISYEWVRWWRLLWYLKGSEPSFEERDLTELLGITLVWSFGTAEVSGMNVVLPEKSALETKFEEAPDAIKLSIPDWLHEYGNAQLPGNWFSEMEASNRQADVFIRTNTKKISPAKLRTQLEESGFVCESVPHLAGAFKVTGKGSLTGTDSFKSGLFEIQDIGSQQIAPFLEVSPGMRIIDACAGAGGKTLHINTLVGEKGRIVAMDSDRQKLDELRIRARRVSASNIEPVAVDHPDVISSRAGTADRLLLDVPCSGSGVLKRNPGSKWRLTEADVNKVLFQQAHLLHSYSAMVKPGGKMVYATCSLFRSENQQQIEQFLSSHAHFELEAEKQVFPSEGGDGFYMARLTRAK